MSNSNPCSIMGCKNPGGLLHAHNHDDNHDNNLAQKVQGVGTPSSRSGLAKHPASASTEETSNFSSSRVETERSEIDRTYGYSIRHTQYSSVSSPFFTSAPDSTIIKDTGVLHTSSSLVPSTTKSTFLHSQEASGTFAAGPSTSNQLGRKLTVGLKAGSSSLDDLSQILQGFSTDHPSVSASFPQSLPEISVVGISAAGSTSSIGGISLIENPVSPENLTLPQDLTSPRFSFSYDTHPFEAASAPTERSNLPLPSTYRKKKFPRVVSGLPGLDKRFRSVRFKGPNSYFLHTFVAGASSWNLSIKGFKLINKFRPRRRRSSFDGIPKGIFQERRRYSTESKAMAELIKPSELIKVVQFKDGGRTSWLSLNSAETSEPRFYNTLTNVTSHTLPDLCEIVTVEVHRILNDGFKRTNSGNVKRVMHSWYEGMAGSESLGYKVWFNKQSGEVTIIKPHILEMINAVGFKGFTGENHANGSSILDVVPAHRVPSALETPAEEIASTCECTKIASGRCVANWEEFSCHQHIKSFHYINVLTGVRNDDFPATFIAGIEAEARRKIASTVFNRENTKDIWQTDSSGHIFAGIVTSHCDCQKTIEGRSGNHWTPLGCATHRDSIEWQYRQRPELRCDLPQEWANYLLTWEAGRNEFSMTQAQIDEEDNLEIDARVAYVAEYRAFPREPFDFREYLRQVANRGRKDTVSHDRVDNQNAHEQPHHEVAAAHGRLVSFGAREPPDNEVAAAHGRLVSFDAREPPNNEHLLVSSSSRIPAQDSNNEAVFASSSSLFPARDRNSPFGTPRPRAFGRSDQEMARIAALGGKSSLAPRACDLNKPPKVGAIHAAALGPGAISHGQINVNLMKGLDEYGEPARVVNAEDDFNLSREYYKKPADDALVTSVVDMFITAWSYVQFWGKIKNVMKGKPVNQEQINENIRYAKKLQPVAISFVFLWPIFLIGGTLFFAFALPAIVPGVLRPCEAVEQRTPQGNVPDWCSKQIVDGHTIDTPFGRMDIPRASSSYFGSLSSASALSAASMASVAAAHVAVAVTTTVAPSVSAGSSSHEDSLSVVPLATTAALPGLVGHEVLATTTVSASVASVVPASTKTVLFEHGLTILAAGSLRPSPTVAPTLFGGGNATVTINHLRHLAAAKLNNVLDVPSSLVAGSSDVASTGLVLPLPQVVAISTVLVTSVFATVTKTVLSVAPVVSSAVAGSPTSSEASASSSTAADSGAACLGGTAAMLLAGLVVGALACAV